MKRTTVLIAILLSIAGLWRMQGQTFSENFDNQTVGQAPAGWTSYTTQTDDPGFVVANDTGVARSFPQFLAHYGVDLNQESTAWIVSPAINVGQSQELIFYWREKWSYAYNYSGVFISTASNDPLNNSSDFIELAEFNPDDYPNTWNQWNKAMFDLRAYAGQTVYIAFKYTGDFAHDFYVDDFQVSDIPYCNPTTNINVVAYTDSTLEVSWDAVQNVDTYEIVWGPQGFNPDSIPATQVTGTSYTITGLQPATWYDIYVRTVCSSYNYSSWSGPESGRTSGPPPANDTCGGAINLTVYPVGGGAGNETAGDTWDATASSMSQTSCDSYGVNLDLFYTFTAPADGNVVILTGGPQGDRIEAAIYDSCGGNELFCFSQGTRKIATGLTAGQTYILQVWHDSFNKGQFNIVLEELPPPPANNDCSGAIDLTVYPAGGGAGNETNGDTTDALPSSMSQTSCDNSGTNLDLFYTFTAPANGSVKIITGGATGSHIEAAIYDACNGNEIDCFGQSSSKIATGLTPGQTYILQVWHDQGNEGPFTIVLEEGPDASSNDTCDTAMSLSVDTSCNPVIVNNTGATDSGVASPGCGGYQGGDLWFTAVVPASGAFVVETSQVSGSNVTDTGLAVYAGDCNNLNLIDCDDDGGNGLFSRITVNNMNPGDTIYIRVWEYGNNSFGEFGVCIYSIDTTPPANDDCANAINLTVYPAGGGAGNETDASTYAATASSMSQTSCDNSGTNLDLFYTFTAPANGSVKIITGGASGSTIEAAIYDACNGNEVDCFGRSSLKIATGLTPGQTYILQVWHDQGNEGTFNIVLEEGPNPATNDDCASAQALTVNASCTPEVVNNIGATDSGVADPGCASYNGADVWFTAVIPSTGNLTVETVDTGGSVHDTGMAVYSGDCNNLSLIECNDDGGQGYFSKVELSGRTAGETIYIRVWEYGGNSFGEFGICAHDPGTSVEEIDMAGFNFYPNPTNGTLNLSADKNISKVEISNLTGQIVQAGDINNTSATLNIQNLPAGVYMLTVYIDGNRGTYRLIKE